MKVAGGVPKHGAGTNPAAIRRWLNFGLTLGLGNAVGFRMAGWLWTVVVDRLLFLLLIVVVFRWLLAIPNYWIFYWFIAGI